MVRGFQVTRSQSQPQGIWDYVSFGLLIGVFVGFLIISGALLLGRIRSLAITTVSVTGAGYIAESDIRYVANQYRNRVCLRITSCSNTMFFSYRAFKQYLYETYPRIQDIDIRVQSGTLVIEITEYPHQSIWCTRMPVWYYTGDDPLCWFVDARGVLVSIAPVIDPGVLLIIVPNTNRVMVSNARTGARVLLPAEISALLELQRSLSSNYSAVIARYDMYSWELLGQSLFGQSISDDAYIRIDRNRITDTGYQNRIVTVLQSLTDFEPFRSQFSATPQALQYIDMRFDEKMYFRFRD